MMGKLIEDLGNGVFLEMVEIPAGEFMMGSEQYDGEKPQHKVVVPAFFIGKYQITQAQWKAIMGNNPSNFTGDDNLPVENVSWNDSTKFCEMLSEKTGRKYRLPSEAEWEYACRAGSSTAFAFGERITKDIVNYDWNIGKTTPVGSLGVANKFGLYDMHGNVWEWCQDTYQDSYNNAPTDGSAWEIQPSNNMPRVLRGGSYGSLAGVCRSAIRNWNAPDLRVDGSGFRVVCVLSTRLKMLEDQILKNVNIITSPDICNEVIFPQTGASILKVLNETHCSINIKDIREKIKNVDLNKKRLKNILKIGIFAGFIKSTIDINHNAYNVKYYRAYKITKLGKRILEQMEKIKDE